MLLVISTGVIAQADSSKTKLSVTIAAKTCEYIVQYFEKTNKYEDIDSVSRSKFRVQSPPVNNNSVVIDSIEGRVLLDIYVKLSHDVIALSDTTKVVKDFEDACRQSGGIWINNKIDNVKKDKRTYYDNIRELGRGYLRKQQTF